MKIFEITSSNRNDFCADMECEHCGSKQKLTTGYNDSYYHEKVIPSIVCLVCKQDRKGTSDGKPE